ncbi:sarcosine oxidase subunit gamma [Wenxinia marina]|uniref:Sarcosine oxidase gamma subunit n=1 Tax=Wenxinia marina DSM 24838 TaxID=1123501 RepID=A0A0D0NM41_9RHOB|nr:sarcosine oxidase subunit gamma family protein [Wenxinia marina]KIQ69355.1 Sarcosine oxidase gamma subunit [Wenxinia marina DSM 24838]GGL57672.1 sarcosine oxidase subunit gamma [Wenxinia marina]
MAEAVSALWGREDGARVQVRDGGLRGMVTIRADLSDEAVQRTVGEVAGVHLPERGRASMKGERALLWMSPDELLLVAPYGAGGGLVSALGEKLEGVHHLAADVSDARAVIEVEGPGVRDVLAKLAPVDLSRGAFPVGAFRRTRLGQVAAAFWLETDERAQVICFRSVAEYVFGLLAASAKDGEVGFYG